MAAGRLPAPGTEYGPCKDPCKHPDCQTTRDMAAAVCHYCEKAIDYETAFYQDPDAEGQPVRKYVHALCLEEAVGH